jgi:hypothetical protein
MTEIYLDDARLDYEDTEEDSTVGELIVAVEGQLRGLRRFVLELSIDGEKRDDWRGSALLEKKLARFEELKFVSASVETVALEGIDVLQQYMKVIAENIAECVKGIRLGGDVDEPLLTSVTGGMSEVVKTMNALTKGGGSYNMDLFREDPANFYKPVLDCLEAMQEARLSGDSVLLADVLEHELAPLIDEISSKIFPVSRS